MKRRL